ncbi:MAG: two-component regulator propeller domain-containing protein, partial [Bacteroidota bacterium]
MPSRIVRDVSQDSLGYLWVAGNNGLYKFDGKKFYGYYAKLGDTIGLRDNKINTVLAGRNNKVWIATPKGLHLLEGEGIHYVRLKDNPSQSEDHIIALFEDSDGKIWIGTYGGLFVIDLKEDSIHDFSSGDEKLFKNTSVTGITEDTQGRIWVCRSIKPPVIVHKDNYQTLEVTLHIEGQQDISTLNPFKYVPYSKDYMLVSSGTGLYKASRLQEGIWKVENFRDEQGSLAARHFLYNTIIDRECYIWNATWKNYFTKYRLEDGMLLEEEVISNNGFLDMSVFARSLFEDSQGNIWIPNSNGLYKFSRDSGKLSVFPPNHVDNCLENISIYGFAEDGGGHLWVNTPTHLYRINKTDILERRCPEDFLTFQNPHFALARDLLVDSQNRLWISGSEGLSVAQLDGNFEPGPFSHFTEKEGLPHKWSNGILEQDPNTFWVGNYIRLIKIQLPGGDFQRPIITSYNSNEEREDALVNSFTLQLEMDKDENLWVGTFSGISKLVSDEGEGVFKNYLSELGAIDQLSNNSIKKIFKDSKGRLWVGTQTGLNLYVPEEDRFLQFGRKDGLPSEYILGIAENSKGQLWITTTQGVFKAIYNESMKGFVHIDYFTKREGLADNISNRNALYIDSDDNVFIGSAKGISIFNKDNVAVNAREFHMALTTLGTTGKSQQGFKSIKSEMTNNEIDLSYRNNSIQLNYAVLDYTNPSHNTYRHKFLPVSEDWIYTQGNSELNYYHLAPGEYQLVLDGSNSQGIWSKAPIKLKIVIKPPFWKSGWAIALYALFVASLVRLFYVFRIRKRM